MNIAEVDSDISVSSPAPPEGLRFKSFKDAREYCSNWAKDYGMALVCGRSSNMLYCHKGGMYMNKSKLSDENRKRKTTTQKINCPYKIRIRKFRQSTAPNPYYLECLSNIHNHPLSPDAAFITINRVRHTVAFNNTLSALIENKVEPKKIKSILEQCYPNEPIIIKDIYNYKNRLKNAKSKE